MEGVTPIGGRSDRVPPGRNLVPEAALLLLLGAPRSGTTWLGKIFDSHPGVRYRHEPDTVRREGRLPMLCPTADIALYHDLAGAYLQRLAGACTVKTAASRPMLRKAGETALGFAARVGVASGLRGLEQAAWQLGLRIRLPVPEPALGGRAARVVIKSVSARGRAGLFADAAPLARIVFLLRHPCGQVASMMRGAALGKFDVDTEFGQVLAGEVFATEQVRRTGLTRAGFQALPDLEKFAWNWALLNAKALDDLALVRGGTDGGGRGVRVVRYEDLCADPQAQAQALFAFAGLDWSEATAGFLRRSTSYNGPERYYQVFKTTSATQATGWRRRLDAGQQQRIMAIVARTSLRRFWPTECAGLPN